MTTSSAHAQTSVAERMRVASAHFDAQDFDGALRLYQQLYVETQDPPLLLNVGTCLERLERRREAVTALQRFVELDPSSPARSSAETAIARIEAQIRAQNTVVQPANPPVISAPVARVTPPVAIIPNPQPPPPRAPVAAWVVVGLGGAAIATAPILFFAVREPALASLPAGCDRGTGLCSPSSVTPSDLERANRDADTARTATTIAGISLGVGAIAVGAGITWAVLGGRESYPQRVSVIPTRDGAVVSVGGQF